MQVCENVECGQGFSAPEDKEAAQMRENMNIQACCRISRSTSTAGRDGVTEKMIARF